MNKTVIPLSNGDFTVVSGTPKSKKIARTIWHNSRYSSVLETTAKTEHPPQQWNPDHFVGFFVTSNQ